MLRKHKLRAFLTMLGVIIGVMSVTMIVMISSGFQTYLDNQFQKAGADTLFVFFDPGRRGRGMTTGGKEKLTTDDVTFITTRVNSITIASSVMQVPGQKVRYGDQEYTSPQVYASDENFKTLNSFDFLSGRSLTKTDTSKKPTCVLSAKTFRRHYSAKTQPLANS